MKKFYSTIEKGATMSHQLTWSHYVELLKFDYFNITNYYVNISINQNLSIRELRNKIKNRFNQNKNSILLFSYKLSFY